MKPMRLNVLTAFRRVNIWWNTVWMSVWGLPSGSTDTWYILKNTDTLFIIPLLLFLLFAVHCTELLKRSTVSVVSASEAQEHRETSTQYQSYVSEWTFLTLFSPSGSRMNQGDKKFTDLTVSSTFLQILPVDREKIRILKLSERN